MQTVYYNDDVHFFQGSVTANYHFNKLIPVRNLDVYTAIGISVRTFLLTTQGPYTEYDGYKRTKPGFVARVGVRYYLTNAFGLYGDFGYDGLSAANLGISFGFGRGGISF